MAEEILFVFRFDVWPGTRKTVTINSQFCDRMINDFLRSVIENAEVRSIWHWPNSSIYFVFIA